MIVEFKEAAYEKAFELLDDAKSYSKKTKMVLCALEDALYDCYEASKHADDEEYHEEDFEHPYDGDNDEESEVNYRRGSRLMRRGMRHVSGEIHDDGETHYRRHSMRMRRNKMGRYY